MLTQTEEQKRNEALACQINQEALNNPQSPYAGKCVGILSGKAVVVVDTLDEAVEAMAKIEPNRNRGIIIEASIDYNQTEYIWRIG